MHGIGTAQHTTEIRIFHDMFYKVPSTDGQCRHVFGNMDEKKSL